MSGKLNGVLNFKVNNLNLTSLEFYFKLNQFSFNCLLNVIRQD